MRFYLRVDATLIRVYDTRIYHEVENDHVLREYSEREEAVEKLTVAREVWTDHNEIVNHLPVKNPVLDDHEQVDYQVEVVEDVEAAPHFRLDILGQLQGAIHGELSHNTRVFQG